MNMKINAALMIAGLFAATAAQGAIVENFESSTQGALSSGAAVGDFTATIASGGSAAITSSPFVDGGDNAFQFSGATGNQVRLTSGSVGVDGEFIVSFDIRVASAYDTSTGSQTVWVRKASGFITRIFYRDFGDTVRFSATNGSGPADLVFIDKNVNNHVTIIGDPVAGTYDLTVKLDDDTTVVSLIGRTFEGGAGALDNVVFGDIAGTGVNATLDNIVLTAVPEPASACLIGAAVLMLGLRDRRM